jgi:phosphoserine aminotransferase
LVDKKRGGEEIGNVHIAATTKAEQFTRVPRAEELVLTPGAAYLHFTSNNTIYGTQWKALPDTGDVPLVNDTSSDMFSRPIDVAKHGVIYAGAQKNMGPAGVTIVIVREDLLPRSAASLPAMLSYGIHAANGSLYNTPPVFAIYMVGLVMKWLRARGGLDAIAKVNERKAAKLCAIRSHEVLLRRAQRTAARCERHLQAVGEARNAVREGRREGAAGRLERTPVGWRHPRVDLQRVPGRRSRCAGRLHAGFRTP